MRWLATGGGRDEPPDDNEEDYDSDDEEERPEEEKEEDDIELPPGINTECTSMVPWMTAVPRVVCGGLSPVTRPLGMMLLMGLLFRHERGGDRDAQGRPASAQGQGGEAGEEGHHQGEARG